MADLTLQKIVSMKAVYRKGKRLEKAMNRYVILGRTLLRKCEDKPHTGRSYFLIIYLIKDWYPERIKNSQNLRTEQLQF